MNNKYTPHHFLVSERITSNDCLKMLRENI